MSKSIKEIISENISKYRKECGLSQKELAEKVGAKNLTTISSWERGVSSPDADTIIKLCKLFNISLNDLYNVQNSDFNLTSDEKNHIKKYRILDDYGKNTIDLMLDREYERSKYSSGNEEIAEEIFPSTGPQLTAEDERMIEQIKQEMLAEKRGRTSSASTFTKDA